MDRESQSVAKEVIEQLCPSPDARQAWIDLVLTSIRAAASVSSEAWEISLFPRLVRLNVGQISVLELFSDCVGLYTESQLSSLRKRGIKLVRWSSYAALPVPSQRWRVSHGALRRLPVSLHEAHVSLVKTAAMAKARSPFRSAHSPGVVAYLEAASPERSSLQMIQAPLVKPDTEIGSGFGDPETNRVVEEAAVAIVREHYSSNGWSVSTVEREKIGYDLRCQKGCFEKHVEVKGAGRTCTTFLITAQEVRAALTDEDFVLALVDGVHSGSPRLRSYPAKDFRTSFILEPIQYRARIKSAG